MFPSTMLSPNSCISVFTRNDIIYTSMYRRCCSAAFSAAACLLASAVDIMPARAEVEILVAESAPLTSPTLSGSTIW